MKQIVNVALGGRCFVLDDDAYQSLMSYLDAFKNGSHMGDQSKEVMDEVEMSIADIFQELLANARVDVVSDAMVSQVIQRLGMPDGSKFDPAAAGKNKEDGKIDRKLFRDPDDKKIGGVCSGLAAFFTVDVTILRVVFLVAMIFGSVGFWVYIVFWIAMPEAKTAAQKCVMRGEKVTAENMRKYTTSK